MRYGGAGRPRWAEPCSAGAVGRWLVERAAGGARARWVTTVGRHAVAVGGPPAAALAERGSALRGVVLPPDCTGEL